MAVNWTKEQLEAITLRGSNILVAAAAGSGKTAVLVERIIRMICDAENPVPVDRLLVLTFTEAAASEMKRKIAAAIEERLADDPENRRLREQSILVHSAHISTVHAFCKNILQNMIHKTNLPIDFTMLSEAESAMLRKEALDEVLEQYYQRIGKKDAFRALALGYDGTKSDEGLRSVVLRLHSYVQSLAYPAKWLHKAAAQYQIAAKQGTIDGTVWEELLLTLGRELVADMHDGLVRIAEIVENEVPSDHKYFAYYKNLLSDFETVYAPVLSGAAGLSVLKRCREVFVIPRAPVKTGLMEETVRKINAAKEQLVTGVQKELGALLDAAAPERLMRIFLCKDRIMVLKQLVRQTERLYLKKKRECSGLDFGDLEHEMLRLLSDAKGRPTAAAMSLRNRFDEILVDEYQDTNDIQDTIFTMLSKDNRNIFMVGDLKQSIYRFRNADPGIFAEKYARYRRGDGGVCIRLFKNFRSRREVVDSVNSIFASIMTKQTGGLDYTEEEYLIPGAVYAENAGDFTTEVLLTDADKNHYDPDSPYAAMEIPRLEAITVAKRIRKMVDSKELMVTDKKTNALRPVRLGDITVLVRTKANVAEIARTLAEYDIPSISEVGQKYLDSVEVLTVLSFLEIIGNPRQDIPLLAVLRSPIFAFTPDELAKIRLADGRRGCFYDALCAASAAENPRVSYFLESLSMLRGMAVRCGVDELIWKICHDLHYMALAGAMPNGRVRQANLNLLYEHGAAFEQGSMRGLFQFMLYIDQLRSQNQDMKAAAAFADEENTVSIMTIHKSKGLEYPVVILCGMDRQFNERDTAAAVLWHKNSGIAMDYIDTKLRIRYKSLAKQITREQMLRDSRAEEMRLFYVALTRAKEKLILSAPVGTFYDAWKKAIPANGQKPAPGILRRQKSTRDWTLTALLAHPDGGILREIADCAAVQPPESMQAAFSMSLYRPDGAETPQRRTAATAAEQTSEKEYDAAALSRFSYEYPHKGLCKIPVKLSISELKRRVVPEEEYVPNLLRYTMPRLAEHMEIGAAERGTITHYVMQHLDLQKTASVTQIEDQLHAMTARGLLYENQARAVSAAQIARFFQSELGKRLVRSAHVEREFDFYMQVPAKTIEKGLSAEDGEEKVLLQGIADCFFYEDDGVVLIDYKTDYITEDEASARAAYYKTQIAYYADGLKSVLECPVKERYLYFLNCAQAVAV